MSKQPISRRALLRGLGTVVALPALDAMLPGTLLAAPARKRRPLRLAFLFVPNGAHMPAWTPADEGTAYTLPTTLEPLQGVKSSLTVLTGLTQDKARAHGDGGGDHARSAAAWLTGCQPRKTAGADIKAGISADQLVALRIGNQTRFPSLEIGCEGSAQAGNCDSGYSCAYSSCISWHGESTPVAKEVNPRLVFERFFGSDDPTETAESRHRRNQDRLSVLDFVMDDAKRLQNQLGAHDQRKMDEYFTGIRDIEQQLVKVEQTGNEAGIAGIQPPAGTPGQMDEHLRLLGDMMVLAFQADMTRVCTFMFANEGSNRSYALAGVPEGHHDVSHHGGSPEKQAKIRQINRFHVTQLAYVLNKMQSIHDGDGTLLDNSIVVYGGGISDGDAHNHNNLPIIMAGRGAGTLPSGRHLRFPSETPLNNLYLSLLDRMGVHTETLGDSTGRLQQLL